ncbi:hypothetical protein MNBD_ALPHA09-1276 [hydrothermal vent metagenome]|uniref:Uncharacterized protein n=1 Tax=hydrothermal vent metagenome TaxID=652676 RepID=A0A3B0T8D9_9ZZZZ
MRKIVSTTAGVTIAVTASMGVGLAQEMPLFFEPGQLPAVSGPNFKVQAGGFAADGSDNSDGLFEVRGSYAAPLSFSTGFQLDGVIAGVEGGDETWVAVAGHYFWRDPASYLLGVYGDINFYDDITYGVMALEGEAYVGKFTLASATGVEFGDVDTSFYTNSFVNYYVTDDLMVGAGYRHDSAGSYGQAKVEYQVMPEFSGLSLYAEGKWSNDDYDAVFAGLRFYFGAPKSLIRRHREDDPGTNFNPSAGVKANKPMPVVAPSGGDGEGET